MQQTTIDSDREQVARDQRDKIVSHLKEGIKAGKRYFKSKYIGRAIGLSPKEVGGRMAQLMQLCDELRIIKYSYSGSTTWLVTVAE